METHPSSGVGVARVSRGQVEGLFWQAAHASLGLLAAGSLKLQERTFQETPLTRPSCDTPRQANRPQTSCVKLPCAPSLSPLKPPRHRPTRTHKGTRAQKNTLAQGTKQQGRTAKNTLPGHVKTRAQLPTSSAATRNSCTHNGLHLLHPLNFTLLECGGGEEGEVGSQVESNQQLLGRNAKSEGGREGVE